MSHGEVVRKRSNGAPGRPGESALQITDIFQNLNLESYFTRFHRENFHGSKSHQNLVKIRRQLATKCLRKKSQSKKPKR